MHNHSHSFVVYILSHSPILFHLSTFKNKTYLFTNFHQIFDQFNRIGVGERTLQKNETPGWPSRPSPSVGRSTKRGWASFWSNFAWRIRKRSGWWIRSELNWEMRPIGANGSAQASYKFIINSIFSHPLYISISDIVPCPMELFSRDFDRLQLLPFPQICQPWMLQCSVHCHSLPSIGHQQSSNEILGI